MILGGAGAVSGYTGPGDILSFFSWYGLRGYSNAAAAPGTTKALNVRRASDNTTQDIVILNSGALDAASALSFAGTDATGNATSVGTAVALTGLSGAAHVGDTITGTGFSGTYCVSVGSLVAGAQTVTTNTSQNIGVSEPVTLTWGLYVATFYDQAGGGNDLTQATAGNQPQLILTGGPSSALPWLNFVGSSAQILSKTTATGISSIGTFSWTAIRPGASSGAFQVVIGTNGGGGSLSTGFDATNNAYMWAGTTQDATATDNVWHAVQAVGNGVSSVLYIDGSSNSINPGGRNTGSNINMGNDIGGGQALTGAIVEAGLSNNVASGGQQSSLNSNSHTYWGF